MPLPPHHWILEGVITTLPPEFPEAPKPPENSAAETSGVNIAPMGPIVSPGYAEFIFRPYKTSTTYRNLKATGQAVFHVTDDALLIARAAVGKVVPGPGVPVRAAEHVRGMVLTDACRYYELRVVGLDDREDRTVIRAVPLAARTLRDFAGFHRARHAVLEAAILATRVHLTGAAAVLAEFDRLQAAVDKTGAPDGPEHMAMAELRAYVQDWKVQHEDAKNTKESAK